MYGSHFAVARNNDGVPLRSRQSNAAAGSVGSTLSRERDRERAEARAGSKPKQPRDDGLTPEQKRERDAKALQEKAAGKSMRMRCSEGTSTVI